jgi:hypothetical protein
VPTLSLVLELLLAASADGGRGSPRSAAEGGPNRLPFLSTVENGASGELAHL